MFLRFESELALVKGIKVRLHPPEAEAYAELKPAMFICRAIERVSENNGNFGFYYLCYLSVAYSAIN